MDRYRACVADGFGDPANFAEGFDMTTPMEAAARALRAACYGGTFDNMNCGDLAKAAVTAHLAKAAEDPATVERVAQAINKLDTWNRLPEIRKFARAAIKAIRDE